MQFIGEIRAFAFGTAPTDWLPCNGKLLLISQYAALYNLIGTTYGGDGKTTFALPDLSGRVLVGAALSGNEPYALGAMGGEANVSLQPGQEAPHNHHFFVVKSADAGALSTATNMPGYDSLFCNALFVSRSSPEVLMSFNNTDTVLSTALGQDSVTFSPGGEPHQNRQPYLTVNYCIATIGIYPSSQQQ